VRRLLLVLVAAGPLAAPPAAAAARLPGGAVVALAAGRGTAYAVVSSRARARPFRLVRSGGGGASALGAFGSPGAEFADVAAGPAGPVVEFARPSSDGYAYESSAPAAGGGLGAPALLGEGTGPAVLALDGETRAAVFPDDDGDATIARLDPAGQASRTALTSTGPALRHTPLDAVVAGGRPLVLDRVESGARSELRLLGPDAPSAPVASAPLRRPLDATLARDGERVYVAYRDGARRLVLASAAPRPGAHWSRRRLRVRGRISGAPGVTRVGRRTVVATSERAGRRYRVFLTTVRPAGTSRRRLSGGGGSDLGPLLASGPDGRAYVAWSHRASGRGTRGAVLRRVL
jgi:hypothetical protein